MKGSHTYLHSLLYIKAMLRCHAAVSFHIHPCPWNAYAKVQRHVRKDARGRLKHATHREKKAQPKGRVVVAFLNSSVHLYIRRRGRHYTIELRITLPPDWVLNGTLHHMQKALFGRRNKGFIRSIIKKNANFLNLAARFVNNFHALHI